MEERGITSLMMGLVEDLEGEPVCFFFKGNNEARTS